MQNGLYKVAFATPLGSGSGVAYLFDGRIRGGDAGLAYIGEFSLEGGQFKASVRTQRHTTHPGVTSVFGKDTVNINLEGKFEGNSGRMTGRAAEAPTVQFTATFTKISD
jgi:hypothetical protein